jgi:predicted O-methyltransferase YrrM
MISIIGNLSTLGGALVASFAIIVQYLIPLWPAEGVDAMRVQLHLEILQYGGVVLALIGGCLIAWKAASRARRIRVATLVICVAALTGFSALRGNPETTPRSVIAASALPSKYRFSEDWTSENIAKWDQLLADFKGKPNIHALEVGSFEGRSALWFLENILTGPSASITCVDIWVGPYEKTFDENVKAYGYPGKVIKIKSRSDEALRALKARSFDFIYIDGSHMAKDVLVDSVLAWDLLKPGGLVIFDDYNWYGPRSWLVSNYTPKIAINAFVQIFSPYLELVEKDYQLVVRKKTDPSNVDLETSKPIRSFIIGIQRALG